MADTRTRDLFPQTLPGNFAHIITPHIVFGDIDIRQDAQGRYCLNDLHKAAGGEGKCQPNRWFRIGRTKALISKFLTPKMASENAPSDAISGVAPVTVESVGKPSIYVIKPLVYNYAAWVSPDFERFVYEVFDAVMSAAAAEQQRGFTALFNLRQKWKPIYENPGLSRVELIKLTGHKNPGSITGNRHKMREVGLLDRAAAPSTGNLFAREG